MMPPIHLYIIFMWNYLWHRLPWWLSAKESTCQFRKCGFDPWVGKIPWGRKWQHTPVFLPGEWTEKLGGLQSRVGSQKVRHDQVTNTSFSLRLRSVMCFKSLRNCLIKKIFIFVDFFSLWKKNYGVAEMMMLMLKLKLDVRSNETTFKVL